MLRAMYTSITGLRNHQTLLDNIGNNIANVNTSGFKASAVTFETVLSQTSQAAGAPNAVLGGTNNQQVGLGMKVGAISQVHTQGALQTTGVGTDLAIQGAGYFEVTKNPTNLATNTAPMEYSRAGNFKFDANGTLVTNDGAFVTGFGVITTPGAPGPPPTPTTYAPDPTTRATIDYNPKTQYDPQIAPTGEVTVKDKATNAIVTIGYIAMANFANPSGLTQVGNTRWQQSLNSGSPVEDQPKLNGMGELAVGYLEMSNVDLASEFTEMIKAQRGFQANSRVITTSDEILQELVNLKR